MIRVLIVDDHPVVRNGLQGFLNAQPDLVVVGAASDGEEALRQIEALRPDVVSLDICLPGLDGPAVAAAIRAASGSPRAGAERR